MHPIIQQLFELIDADPRTYREISRLAGINHRALGTWKSGRNRPRLMMVEAVLNVLGYELWVEYTSLDMAA